MNALLVNWVRPYAGWAALVLVVAAIFGGLIAADYQGNRVKEQMPNPIRWGIPRFGVLDSHNVKPQSTAPPLESVIGVARRPRHKLGSAK